MEHKEAYPASGDSISLGWVASSRIDYTEIALAERFYYGREVPRNLAAAWRWYRNAAERGEPLAQYQLGRMYTEGQGADADPLKAYMWVELASKRSTGPLKEKCLEFLAHLAERLAPAGVEGEARTEDIPFFGALERERRLGPLR